MIDYKQRFEEFLTICGMSPHLASNPIEYIRVAALKIAAMTEQKPAVEKAAEFGRYLATSATNLEDFISETGLLALEDNTLETLSGLLAAVRRDVYEFEKRYQRYLSIRDQGAGGK